MSNQNECYMKLPIVCGGCNGGGGSGSSRYVSGYFEDVASPGSWTSVVMTPEQGTLKGETDLVEGTDFVAPEDGIYVLSVGFSLTQNNAPLSSRFISSLDEDGTIIEMHVGQASLSNAQGIPGAVGVCWLDAGQKMQAGFNTSNPHSSTRYSGHTVFTFAKIG